MSKLRPMLACPTTDLPLQFPGILSPKLDGIRGLGLGQLMSRKLLPIPNLHTQKRFGIPELHGIDGELILGAPHAEGVYLKTHSAVMTMEGTPNVSFYVFDDFTHPDKNYEDRWVDTANRVEALGFSHVKLLDAYWIETQEELDKYEDLFLHIGFEGAIFRHPGGKYKYGRSTEAQGWMLKIKRFVDSEATVLDFVEGMTNTNPAEKDELGLTKRSSHKAFQVPTGTLGALVVRDIHHGWEFSIGTGFTAKQRAEIWANRDTIRNTIVKYQYFPKGMKDSPRFPSYRGPRSLLDMD